jgi:tRNA threonylcarbamoyladenosine biosynthesis protein TsaB
MPGMKILAIETSTDSGTCALWWDGALAERICPPGRPHSETLLPLLGGLLADAGIGFHRLDGIAFGAGPGAFTGLRVACAVAQGLAVGADLPLAPVCGLEAMAESRRGPRFRPARRAHGRGLFGGVRTARRRP